MIEKIHHANSNHKKNEVTVLMSDTTDFKIKYVTRDKK